MKRLLFALIAILGGLSACKNEPQGQWVATERVTVYTANDERFDIAFYLEKGDICAKSVEWDIKKTIGYKEVRCQRGHGWVTTDSAFKKLP